MHPYSTEVITLTGELLDRSVIYLTGSHLYGLNTPESDTDYTVIYHDPIDDRRVFRHHPDVQHSVRNDHKLYALRKFAELLAKGNPNAVELVARHESIRQHRHHTTNLASREHITDFMIAMQPHLVTGHLLASYLGHVNQVLAEITKKGPTGKRVSHAIRLAVCATDLLRDPSTVPDFRQSPWHSLAFDVKTGYVTIPDGLAQLQQFQADMTASIASSRPALPDNTALKSAINDFFTA